METKQKTVTVEIPEGKKAVWNEQGILQLVDDEKKANEPKDVTGRIKTFYDAYSELALYYPAQQKLIEEYDSVKRMEMSDDIVAYMQLRIITAVLNEGWKPKFKEGENRWFPYFALYTKKDIDEMSDEEKDNCHLMMFGSVASIDTDGSSSSITGIGWGVTPSTLGYRLTYKTQTLAAYAARQFASIYARYFIGEKAINATSWREFEQKRKSSGNK